MRRLVRATADIASVQAATLGLKEQGEYNNTFRKKIYKIKNMIPSTSTQHETNDSIMLKCTCNKNVEWSP